MWKPQSPRRSKIGQAVVTVVATIPGQRTFFGVTGDSTSTGSGVIISPGIHPHHNHVIDGGSQFQVILADGSQQEGTLVEPINIQTWQCSKLTAQPLSHPG
jgi:S1-C subfamily serine protease